MADLEVRLAIPEPRPVGLDPRRSALVIIDVENEFMRPAGKRYLGKRAERILGPLATLIGRARRAEVPIVYVRSVRDHDDAEFRVFGVDEHLMRGSWGAEYCSEVAPSAEDVVVEKKSHDSFHGTTLEKALSRLRIRPSQHTVVVCGVASEVCVSHAVLGFSVRDYWVAVPTDCTASRTQEAEIMAYQRFIHRAYAHNVALTRSDLISFGPSLTGPLEQAAMGKSGEP